MPLFAGRVYKSTASANYWSVTVGSVAALLVCRCHGDVHICRLALGGHGQEENGLLTRAGPVSRLVLAGPLQGHVHVGVLPGAVGVVVVALQPL